MERTPSGQFKQRNNLVDWEIEELRVLADWDRFQYANEKTSWIELARWLSRWKWKKLSPDEIRYVVKKARKLFVKSGCGKPKTA